jgi:hypothetical protein
MDLTFAKNIGPDETLVHEGALRLRSRAVGPEQGPKESDIGIALQKPFLYNPAAGKFTSGREELLNRDIGSVRCAPGRG